MRFLACAGVPALTKPAFLNVALGLNHPPNSVFEFATETCHFTIGEGHELYGFFLLKFDLNSTENICGLWFLFL